MSQRFALKGRLVSAAAGCGGLLTLAMTGAPAEAAGRYAHVLLISIDGLHAEDLTRFVAEHPASAMAGLAAQGIYYSNATGSKPSDSFPGLLAMITGGSPASTGVYYDDSYDRTLSAPGSNCSVKGAEIVFDESIDVDPDKMDSGGIDPTKLPLDPATGCKPVWPHSFLRVNTVFEVVKAAGLRTAWSDKHPAYDLVNGPSGKGVDDLYTPEIAAGGSDADAAKSMIYDDGKVTALINEIDGKSHDGSKNVGVPALFGMNFQAVSVAQKVAGGGYRDSQGVPSDVLAAALTHTDQSIGKLAAELKAKNLDRTTLIVISAKHGQAPVDPARRLIVDKKTIPNLIEGVQKDLAAQVTQDSVALIWLSDQSMTAKTIAALAANQGPAAIDRILGPAELRGMFADPAHDSRVPDIIVEPSLGVIYTKTSATKIAEHGGFSYDETAVPILVSAAGMTAGESTAPVTTTQIAPTILKALGLDPQALKAVQIEHTAPLGSDIGF